MLLLLELLQTEEEPKLTWGLLSSSAGDPHFRGDRANTWEDSNSLSSVPGVYK